MSAAAVVNTIPNLGAIRHATQRGFSLLELLVALVVVVIITSMVTLTVSSGGQDIRLESKVRNLADVAGFALDEAQMTGENYGLLLGEDFADGETVAGYSWYLRQLDGWNEFPADQEVFAGVTFPPDIELELEVEDSPLSEVSLGDEEEDEERISPQVVFYASGEVTPAAINVRRREDSELLWRVEWDLLGRFKVLRRGEEREEQEEQ